MKINDINTVLSYERVLESTGPQANDLILESAAEMMRNLRTVFSNGKNPTDELGQNWSVEHIAKFCAALEKIERVVSKQISNNTLQTNLRDTVFSILVTSDFDHATAIEKIVKQSHDQEERVNYWAELMNAQDKTKLQSELDRTARDLSSLVSMLRTKGAQSAPAPKVAPEVSQPEPTL